MSPDQILTVSVPLAFFSAATVNALSKSTQTPSIFFPLNRELLDMPNVIPDLSGSDQDMPFEDELD
jgi:hypothetical protein